MSAVDRIITAALGSLEKRVTAVPSGPLTLRQASAALAELGRGLAAVVDVMYGRPCDYVPGPALAWLDQGAGARSLLGGVAHALGEDFAPGAPRPKYPAISDTEGDDHDV